MPNADCECNSLQARNEKGLKVRTCSQFGEIGRKWQFRPLAPGPNPAKPIEISHPAAIWWSELLNRKAGPC
jgi:hypothetical protein